MDVDRKGRLQNFLHETPNPMEKVQSHLNMVS